MEKTYPIGYIQVYQNCLSMIQQLGYNMNYKKTVNDGYHIQVSTNVSILSWGETIDIHIKHLSESKTKVKITSEASGQLFDWGKNSRNEKKIIDELNHRLL